MKLIVLDNEKKSMSVLILEWLLTIFINALVLLFATNIFRDFYIESFWYALVTALVIVILNKTIKPFINLLTLPITILSLGLFYPFVNVIILKLASWIMGDVFTVDGWIVPFFIAIFISIMTIILDVLITKRILRGVK